MRTCGCGAEITYSGRGRPPKKCAGCRGKVAERTERKEVAVPPEATSFPPPTPIPTTRRVVVSTHRFAVDPHPAAWRFCRICGRSAEMHDPTAKSIAQDAARVAAEYHERKAANARLHAGDTP